MPTPKSTQYRYRGSIAPGSGGPRAQFLSEAPVDGVATMYLYDVIDSFGGSWGVSASEVLIALAQLPKDVTEIRLHVNSPGGDVFEGISIMNSLRNHSAKVVAIVDGLAASAASFIACAADELVMGRNTQLMIHDAWGICIGAAEDMRGTGDLLDKLSDSIASIYAEKAGADIDVMRALMLAETWYSADEAVAAGLADRVEGDTDPAASNSFDLSMFAHAGREDAPAPAPAPAPTEPIAAAATPSPSKAALDTRRHRMNERKAH